MINGLTSDLYDKVPLLPKQGVQASKLSLKNCS